MGPAHRRADAQSNSERPADYPLAIFISGCQATAKRWVECEHHLRTNRQPLLTFLYRKALKEMQPNLYLRGIVAPHDSPAAKLHSGFMQTRD